MPKKSGSNITPAVRRRWLAMADEGMSDEAIAKKEKRDARTVKRHLRDAAEEQQIRVARQEQIRNALQQHSTDILGVLRDLSQVPGAIHDERLTPIGVLKNSSHVSYQHDNYQIDPYTYEVSPPSHSKFFDLAREHLKGETELWKNSKEIESVKLDYMAKCIRLGVEVAGEIEEATGLTPVADGGTASGFHELMVSYICRRAIQKIRRISVREDTPLVVEGSDPRVLRYGGSTLAKGEPEQLERAKDVFVRLIAELTGRDATREIAKLQERADELASAIRDRAADIAMFPYIRGNCRVCKDYSL